MPADMQIRDGLAARGHCLVGADWSRDRSRHVTSSFFRLESRTDFSSHLNPKLTDKGARVSVDYVVVSDSH